MKKDKGFTLVELIAVVVVLGIIAIIAIPAVSKYMYAADDEFYTATENSILASGRDYFSDYTSLLPKQDGDVVSIDVNNELVDGGYIDPIKNNDDEVCNATLYVTRVSNNDYKYCVIITCGDKEKGNTCGDTPPDIPTKDYTIINDGNRTIEQCSTYNDLLNMVDNKFKHNNKIVGKLIRTGDESETPLQNNGADILIYPNETNLNLNAVGRYKLIYEYNGATSTNANIDVVDEEGPNKGELKITFNKTTKDGSTYNCDNDSCNWSNKNIVVTFVGKDLTTKNNCNQPGSGIANFMYKLEGVTTGNVTYNTDWIPVTAFRTGAGTYIGYYKLTENEFRGKIYFNAVDSKGNYAYASGTEPNRYLKIDTIKPTVSITGKRQDNSAEVASGTWVNSLLRYEFTVTSGISGYKVYYCIGSSCTPSASSTLVSDNKVSLSNEGDYIVKYIAISNANTKSDIHSYNGKVDLIAPTCTSSGGVSDWVNTNVTLIGTCHDEGGSQCTGNASRTYSTSGTNLSNQSPGTVYDNAGNSKACPANQTVKIDKVAPACGTNTGNDYWTHVGYWITVNCKAQNPSSLEDYYSDCNNTYVSNFFNSNMTTGTITIADNAGNTTACEVPVYLDLDDPYGTFSFNPVTGSSDADVSVTCKDDFSGIDGEESVNYRIHSSDSPVTVSRECKDKAGNTKTVSKVYSYGRYSSCGTEKYNYHDCKNCCCSASRCVAGTASGTCDCYNDIWHDIEEPCQWNTSCSTVCSNAGATYAGSNWCVDTCTKRESYCTSYTCACGSNDCYDTRYKQCWISS